MSEFEFEEEPSPKRPAAKSRRPEDEEPEREAPAPKRPVAKALPLDDDRNDEKPPPPRRAKDRRPDDDDDFDDRPRRRSSSRSDDYADEPGEPLDILMILKWVTLGIGGVLAILAFAFPLSSFAFAGLGCFLGIAAILIQAEQHRTATSAEQKKTGEGEPKSAERNRGDR